MLGLTVRRLRGVVGMAVLWALVWLSIAGAFVVVVSLLPQPLEPGPDVVAPIHSTVGVLATLAGWGALSGAIFAITLAIAEQRRRVAELSATRIAAWGALGSFALPLAYTVIDTLKRPESLSDWRFSAVALAFCAAAGAACAVVTVAIARRGANHPAGTPGGAA
jgi:hypothetical protein